MEINENLSYFRKVVLQTKERKRGIPMIRATVAVIVVVLLSACVPEGTLENMAKVGEVWQPTTRFSTTEVAYAKGRGDNTIIGQVFVENEDGTIKYKRGLRVFLVPKTPFSEERLHYEADYDGGIYIGAPQAFYTSMRYNRADRSGSFSFSMIPDGKYYLYASTSKIVRGEKVPVTLTTPVSVSDGMTVERDLSDEQ
nr:hypothetical protein [Marinicella sp. W31]MDC2876340.1 hypothetical protein [Marinicella sp. W31]